MATIGTFKKTGNSYNGLIATLHLQASNVNIVAEDSVSSDKAPTHRIFSGKAEIGAAWEKTSRDGVPYMQVKLDDPSLEAPIYATLYDDRGEGFNLVWKRATSNGE